MARPSILDTRTEVEVTRVTVNNRGTQVAGEIHFDLLFYIGKRLVAKQSKTRSFHVKEDNKEAIDAFFKMAEDMVVLDASQWVDPPKGLG
jgi:hypothetical protein